MKREVKLVGSDNIPIKISIVEDNFVRVEQLGSSVTFRLDYRRELFNAIRYVVGLKTK